MKKIDDNGFWILKANPISRVGVFEYLGSQIDLDGSLGLDPSRRYNVLRPASELFDPDAIESFNGKFLIDGHQMIGEEFTPVEKCTIHGTVGHVRPSMDEPDVLIADITICTKTMKDKIEGGKKGLSLGYFCVYVPEIGVYDGKTYEFVQKTLRGNHLALVDRPRNGVFVQDSALMPAGGRKMTVDFVAIDSAIEEMKPMNNEQKNNSAVEETPDAQLMKLLTGQDPEACKACVDFMKDFLAKREAKKSDKGDEGAGAGEGQPTKDGDQPPPPPTQKKEDDKGDEGAGAGAGAGAGEGQGEGAGAGEGAGTGAGAQPDNAGTGEGAGAGEGTGTGEGEGADKGEGDDTNGATATDGGCKGKKSCKDGGKGCEPGDKGCGEAPDAGAGAPKGMANDEAIRKEMFREFKKAQDLAARVSTLTGAFDSADMTEKDVAVYGCKKLGIAFDEANPETAVFAIHGALKYAAVPAQKKAALDSAVPEVSTERDATRKCEDEYFKKED